MDRTEKKCGRCRETLPLEAFYPDQSHKRDGRHSICKECVKAERRRRYAESPEVRARSAAASKAWHQRNAGLKAERRKVLRQEMIAAYGGKCACCGEHRVEFLTMDHVGGWGKEHRAKDPRAGSRMPELLKAEGWPQNGFQLLCWNCNCSHGIYGFCPHDRE